MRISDWSSDVCSSDLTARTETMPAEVAVASHISLDSPLGPLTLRAADGAVIALDWGRQTEAPGSEQALLAEAARQLAAYFAEGHFRFDLPLHPHGSAFQRAVWDFMLAIPAGETRSYEIGREHV